MEKEPVTEASCRYYKSWTVDFVKVRKHVFILKNKFVSENANCKHVLLLQASLREKSVVYSGSRLCGVLPVKFCAVARGYFLLQSIQTGSGNQLASFSQDTWGFFHWWWNDHNMKLTTDRHVVLRIRMFGAVSPTPIFLAPAHKDNCPFYLYSSHAPILFCANSTWICWRTQYFNDCANNLWAVFVPLSRCC